MRRNAAGHDHSTQHLTDVRTRRVFASTGDGCAAIGLGLPGQHAARSAHPAFGARVRAEADDGAPEAGGGAAAAAGQTVVYHDVTGLVPRRRPAERPSLLLHRLRPASRGRVAPLGRVRAAAGRAGDVGRRPSPGRLPPSLPSRAAGRRGPAALPGRPRRGPGSAGAASGTPSRRQMPRPLPPRSPTRPWRRCCRGHGYQTSVTPWSDAQGAPAGATVTFAWPAASARSAAGVWPLLESDDGRRAGASVYDRRASRAHRRPHRPAGRRPAAGRPRDPDPAARRRDAVPAARRDLAAVLVVPLVHGAPVGAAAGVPAWSAPS